MVLQINGDYTHVTPHSLPYTYYSATKSTFNKQYEVISVEWLNKANSISQRIDFNAFAVGALFVKIVLTKQFGKPAISIYAADIEATKRFLKDNDIPIGESGSEHQFCDQLRMGSYYTTDLKVCIKLAQILLVNNHIGLPEVGLPDGNNAIFEFFIGPRARA